MGSLDGKVAVVIGASRGIGKGIAIELALAGATVYVTGRTTAAAGPDAPLPGSLAETVAEIETAGGAALAATCDVTSDDDVSALYRRIDDEQGRLDLVVHSAFNVSAFAPTIGTTCWELPVSAWDDLVRVGARSAYVSAVNAIPLLIKSGGGLIVHISGRGASRYRYNVAYGVDKAAMDKLTSDLAEELRPHGVAAVSLWPSVTRTEQNQPASGVDEFGWPDPDRSADELETPRYTGRAVVALATDPDLATRSGRRFWSAQVAADFDLVDENGRSHPIPAEAS